MDVGFRLTRCTQISLSLQQIDQGILVEELAGIYGTLGLPEYVSSYVCNRTQQVVTVDEYRLSQSVCTSGVSQGSDYLGFLLFILYINDIKKCFKHSNILIYADGGITEGGEFEKRWGDSERP